MENSEIWGHLWGRAEPFLAIFIEKGSFLSKIGSARSQRWPHISEFSILWGHESLHTLFQHYKLRPQLKNLAKWRWKILSYRALKFSVVLFYILGIFTSIVPNCTHFVSYVCSKVTLLRTSTSNADISCSIRRGRWSKSKSNEPQW